MLVAIVVAGFVPPVAPSSVVGRAGVVLVELVVGQFLCADEV